MNASQLIAQVSDRLEQGDKPIRIPYRTLSLIVRTTFDTIREVVMEGEDVKVHQFGRFYFQHRPERMGVHPRTKEPMTIPEKLTMRFKPSDRIGEATIEL